MRRMRSLFAIAGLLVVAYIVTAFSLTVVCYVDEKRGVNRFRPNGEIWKECQEDHLLFPLYFFPVPSHH